MLLDYLEKETIDDVFYYQYTYDTTIPNRLLEEKIEERDVLVPGIGGILGPKITIKTLTYDELSLYPNKIGSKTLLWDLNKLKQVTDTSSIVKYKYNYKGQRIKKEVSGTITEYYYDNDLLIAEKTNGNYMYYTYDENNNIYSLETNEGIYYYIKDICKNILGLVDTNGNYIIKYSYDGWGKLKEKEILTSCYASNNNPFIYKGYYYDVETQLYWVSSRYYSPELCRFIQPADVSSIDPSSINGLNLYSYANNNSIGRVKSSNVANVGMLSGLGMNTMLSTYKLPAVDFNTGSSNYWNLHWVNKLVDTDWPGLFVVSNSAVELINWGLTVYKGSLYCDNDEQHSIYNASLNLSVYAGFNFEKNKYGVELGGSVGRLGYDGRFIDVQVDFLTAKFFFIYGDGKLKIDLGFGWVDFGISIDIVAIIEYLKGNG